LALKRAQTIQRSEKDFLDHIVHEIRARRQAMPRIPIHGVDVGRDESGGRFAVLLENGGDQFVLRIRRRIRLATSLGEAGRKRRWLHIVIVVEQLPFPRRVGGPGRKGTELSVRDDGSRKRSNC